MISSIRGAWSSWIHGSRRETSGCQGLAGQGGGEQALHGDRIGEDGKVLECVLVIVVQRGVTFQELGFFFLVHHIIGRYFPSLSFVSTLFKS